MESVNVDDFFKRVNWFERETGKKPPMSIICEGENGEISDLNWNSGASFNESILEIWWKIMKFRRKHLHPFEKARNDQRFCRGMSYKYLVNFDYSWKLMSFYELLIIMPFYRNSNGNVNAVGLTQSCHTHRNPVQKDCIHVQSSNHLE